jgi:signal transduction histidine kinase
MIRRPVCRLWLAVALFVCAETASAQIKPKVQLAAAEPAASSESNRIHRNEPRRILYLQQRGFPTATTSFEATFVPAMRSFSGELFVEMIEPSALPREEHLQRVEDYLRLKYGNSRFDVVVTAGALPLLVVRHSPGLFGGPQVASIVGPRARITPEDRITGIEGAHVIEANIDLSLSLRPGTRRIVVIDAPGANPTGIEAEFKRYVAAHPEMALDYLRDIPLAETLARVAALPDDAVVHFVKQALPLEASRDVDQSEALSRITRASTVPVFVHLDTYLGDGALGGHVWQPDADAVRLAEMAQQLAMGVAARDIKTEKTTHRSIVDWRQMQRWNIPQERMPAGALMLNPPTSVFQKYPHVTSGVALLLAQLALLTAMIVQLNRRRAAEQAATSHATAMQRTMQRNQELARRLITAQDAERTRIARDLHDGVCQEVASVSAELAYLRQRARSLSNEEAQQTLLAMQTRTAGVAETLRLLSHDLHPSVLQHIGLDAALRSHCAAVERQHAMKVTFSAPPSLEPTGAETATALFRIAQEALRNAALHGHAQHAKVAIERAGDVLIMSIVDDGIGFDVHHARSGGGLGLLSIEERARLARGQALISSRPGRTAVEVFVPLDARDAYTTPTNIAC